MKKLLTKRDTPRDWRGWNDRAVRMLLVLAIALAAFAAGRFTVHQGPKSLAEAMEQMRAGELPAGESAGGGPGGMPGMGDGATATPSAAGGASQRSVE